MDPSPSHAVHAMPAAYTGFAKSISFRRGIAVLRISESLSLIVCSDNDEGIGLGATMS